MPSNESEKKGIVYEAFVKLAFEECLKKTILWEPSWPEILANQDLVYPSTSNPAIVFAITYWGSHEAANKKFWRTVEDCFEVYRVAPNAKFVSVVFEKNVGSDDSLDELLNNYCRGRNISERTSKFLVELQEYVDTDSKVLGFGRGKEAVYAACKALFKSDKQFNRLIKLLGKEIRRVIELSDCEYANIVGLLEKDRTMSASRAGAMQISSFRSTYYKKGLLRLLRLSVEDVSKTLSAIETSDWTNVENELINRLLSVSLIAIRGIAKQIIPSEELKSIKSIGSKGYGVIASQIHELVVDSESNSDFCRYIDHYNDITDDARRRRLFEYFKRISSADDILQARNGVDNDVTLRVWVIDYYLALKRVLTKGKYGFKKLSAELGLPYIGGISPLPSYVSGNRDAITPSKENELFEFVFNDIKSFDYTKLNDEMVVWDRVTTLMKKFDIIELLISNALSKAGIEPCYIEPNFTLRNGFISDELNSSAGSTEMNFKISKNDKTVLIFVVSAYDASHKHKEIAGRIRTIKVSPAYPTGDTLNIVVLDGTLLDSTPDKKIEMMYKAGWDYVFFADELSTMAAQIKLFLD